RSTYLLIAGLIGVALVLTAISVVAIVGTYRETQRQAEANAGDVVAALSSELSNRLQTVDVFLQQMARQLDADTLQVTAEMQPLFEILERAVLQESFGGVMVLDEEGMAVYEYGLATSVPDSFVDSSVYSWHQPLGDQGVFISEPVPANG